jgi:transcriptional regulator with XRE-family HTH domain
MVTVETQGTVGVDEKYAEVEQAAAEILRRGRRDRGLTQLDVADEMRRQGFQWTQPTVARVENGRRHLSLAEARALMDILALNEGAAYLRIDRV